MWYIEECKTHITNGMWMLRQEKSFIILQICLRNFFLFPRKASGGKTQRKSWSTWKKKFFTFSDAIFINSDVGITGHCSLRSFEYDQQQKERRTEITYGLREKLGYRSERRNEKVYLREKFPEKMFFFTNFFSTLRGLFAGNVSFEEFHELSQIQSLKLVFDPW